MFKKINKKGIKIILFIILSIIIIAGVFLIIQKQKKTCHFSITNIKENRYNDDKEEIPPQNPNHPNCITIKNYKYGFLYVHDFDSSICYSTPAVHKTYWEIDGLLKNKSKTRQYLKSIILKIYTKDDNNILLADKYIEINDWVESNQTYPFQIRTQIDRGERGDQVLNKYFNKDDKVRIDVYPYFLSCSY